MEELSKVVHSMSFRGRKSLHAYLVDIHETFIRCYDMTKGTNKRYDTIPEGTDTFEKLEEFLQNDWKEIRGKPAEKKEEPKVETSSFFED